jgi:AcrR family transcriptional regulator
LRADAERNRQQVLEVAQAVFASEGLAVPIDEIARRAGLGVGTLYRHFATKEALYEAILVNRMQALLQEARAGAGAEDPAEAFFDIIGRFIEESVAKKYLIDALAAKGFEFAQALKATKLELRDALAALLKRAQRAKAVRRDVEIREVMALVMGASAAIERLGVDERGRARLHAMVCDGLRTPR